jgi:hypothetical protein
LFQVSLRKIISFHDGRHRLRNTQVLLLQCQKTPKSKTIQTA